MSIGLVVTRGFGNGILVANVGKIVTAGYSIGSGGLFDWKGGSNTYVGQLSGILLAGKQNKILISGS